MCNELNEKKALAFLDRISPVLSTRIYLGYDELLCKDLESRGIGLDDGKITVGKLISLVINDLTGKELGVMTGYDTRIATRFTLMGKR